MLDTIVSLAVCVGLLALSCVRDAASGKVLTMTNNGWFQILFFLLVVLALTKPLGSFMTRVFNREKTFLDPVMRPIEKLVYRLTGVDETKEMRWTEYAGAMLMFSGVTDGRALSDRSACRTICRSIRRISPAWPRTWRSIRQRHLRPTPTGRPTSRKRPCPT